MVVLTHVRQYNAMLLEQREEKNEGTQLLSRFTPTETKFRNTERYTWLVAAQTWSFKVCKYRYSSRELVEDRLRAP